MRTSVTFLFAALLLVVQGSALEVRDPQNRNGQNRGGQNQGQQNQNQANQGNNNNNNNGGNNGGNNGNVDPQTSLTLSQSVLCTACTDDGQNPPVDQQSPSLTSSNNFLNFCRGKTLTNGQQLVDGSCNGVVYGDIIPSSNMPAAKISFPVNGETFPANQQFTFTMRIRNMITGNFVNANTNYYGAPQQLQNGVVVGHSHVTVQLLDSIDTTNPPDPTVFAFFKGINTPANGDVLSVDVTDGLPPGVYRFCTMNTNANHTPVMVAIAQHGSLDDCIYATAVAGGGNNNNNGGNNGNNNNNNNGGNNGNNGNNNAGNVADVSSSVAASTTAAPAATSSAATGNQGQNQGGRGRGRGGRGRGQRGRGRGRNPRRQRSTSKAMA